MILSVITVYVKPAKAETGKTLIVPQDFQSINAAVGNASQGDTIIVKRGVYRENVVIDKSLSLVGEDNEATVIDGGGEGTVVWINADNTALSGFTLKNSGDNFTDSGIYLNGSASVKLSANKVTGNNIGVYITESGSSLLRDNVLTGNKFNFGVYSSSLNGYIQNIDESNTVDGKPIIYWVNQTGKQTPTDAGYIAAVNCTDVTVVDTFLEKNWQNLLFAYTSNSVVTNVTSTLGEDSLWLLESSNCTLQDNNVTANIWGGVALVNSSSCTVQGNTLKNNGGYGLFLSGTCSNLFYHNNFVNNPHQAWLYGENSNSWDNGYPNGGNYWNNYTGVDQKTGPNQNVTGSDGVGDTPIVIDQNNIDHYPLMTPLSTQPPETPLLQFEFSVMAAIAVTSVAVIFIIYFAKKRVNKNLNNPKRRTQK